MNYLNNDLEKLRTNNTSTSYMVEKKLDKLSTENRRKMIREEYQLALTVQNISF